MNSNFTNWSVTTNPTLRYSFMLFLTFLASYSIQAQIYWTGSGSYILNVNTNETFSGPGALTAAHNDAQTLSGHTLMFMPAGLNVYSTDVFNTDHDFTSVTKAITIDGNGATVTNDNISNTSKALWLQPAANATQTVKNITLCSFTHTNGSAIGSTRNTNSFLILENVKVYHSANNSYAVWLEGSCDVIDCDFSNVLQTSNTGGLNIALNAQACTVNITNSTFNCNRKDGLGSSVSINTSGTYYAHTINITGGSISNNNANKCAVYFACGGGTNITIDDVSFINNTASGTDNEASVIYNYRPSGSQTVTIQNSLFTNNNGTALQRNIVRGSSASATTNFYDNRIFVGTGTNSNTIDNNPGAATGNILHGVSLAAAASGNTAISSVTGGGSVAGTAIYNIPVYTSGSCGGACTPSITFGTGASITQCTYLTKGSVLSSTVTGTWYAQQGTTTTNLGSGTSVIIPSSLLSAPTYTVFWQDVAGGSDPIMSGNLGPALAIGTNNNMTPLNSDCLGSLTGTVFQDGTSAAGSANGNSDEGVFLSGITVELLNNLGQVVATTTTNSSGNYNFYNMPDGTYSIRITAPSGYYGSTFQNMGSSTNDSDIVQGTGSTYTIINIVINLNNQATSGNDLFTGSSDYINIGAGFVLTQQALPVTWLSLDVITRDCHNTINWATASETNNHYFEIEKSKDTKVYYPIGQVLGNGDRRVGAKYSFVDDKNNSATNYYRIKQVDYDGQSTYSSVIKASAANCSAEEISLFPNPVSDEILNITFGNSEIQSDMIINVYNQLGVIVLEKIINVSQFDSNIQLNIESLPSGLYTLTTSELGGSQILQKNKFVKL